MSYLSYNLVLHYLSFTSSELALGPTQPPIQWAMWALFPSVKRLGHEADHTYN
jgi:hypothetical protein